jgi:hypothetical protein
MSDMNMGHSLQIIDSSRFLRALAGYAAGVYVPNLDFAPSSFIHVNEAPYFKVVFAVFAVWIEL